MEIGGQLGSIIRNMLVHNWIDEDLNELSVTRTEEMSHNKMKGINVPSEYNIRFKISVRYLHGSVGWGCGEGVW